MSATLGDSARPPVSAGDPQSGTDDDYEKMARRFIAFTGVWCRFLAEVHAGDTLYPQLEITALAPHGGAGQVTTRATIHNQHGQLVLDGEHTYLLKTAQQGISEATL